VKLLAPAAGALELFVDGVATAGIPGPVLAGGADVCEKAEPVEAGSVFHISFPRIVVVFNEISKVRSCRKSGRSRISQACS
jgi:hypothetical protein